jgi:ABC-type Co2+ transport system permease subunit
VIPVGALLSGFAAASGYYFGAKLFHHQPTRLLLCNMISVAITTYFLLNYLNYSLMQIKGQQVSRLISFGQYIGVVLRHQSMEFRIRGAKLGETGDLGSLGYVMAVLQVLGFAVRGLCVYWHLRAAPYCEACGKYLKKQSSTTRYTNDTEKLSSLISTGPL